LREASKANDAGSQASSQISRRLPPPQLSATSSKATNTSRESGASVSPDSAGALPQPAASGARAACFDAAAPSAPRSTPELDHARATAFADTVDALYGVISDQRRAASDHSRRMKWMLSVVVGALLVTVAIGVAQTLLLVRLTRNITVQQQRIEQLMLNQQATLATLLDTDSATASVPAVAPQATTNAPNAAAPRQPADSHPAKAPHSVRHKAAHLY
jgi:hypothetical protein